MTAGRFRAFLGVAMVFLGLVQATLYGVQHEWVPTGLGVLFALLGGAYCWAEVYAAA